MSKLPNKDILPTLERLISRTEDGGEKIQLLACERSAIKQIIEQYGTKERPMSAYFDLENWLYSQTEKPIKVKSAMLWGGLWVVHKMGCIDWDTMRNLYGEFMSKHMEVR